MRRGFLGLSVLLALITLAGCETVKGIGRDIEGASSAVQRSLTARR